MPNEWKKPDLKHIQGNIWPGFNKPHQAFFLLRFERDPEAARAWLNAIRSTVTSAEQVQSFKDALEASPTHAEDEPATWINVAFSYHGIKTLLSIDDDEHVLVKEFPVDFRQGMRDRADQTGDHEPEMGDWLVGGDAEHEADALLIVAADQYDDLRTCCRELEDSRVRLGLRRICTFRGEMLTDGREPFGFRDGVSKIRLDDRDPDTGTGEPWDREEKVGDRVFSGEFILGAGRPRYSPDTRPRTYPKWATDGSYLVFRRLQQHLTAFESMSRRVSRQLTEEYGRQVSPDLVKAKLVGRWPSGAKLNWSDPIKWVDPAPGDKADERHVDVSVADFENDGDGLICPLFAHIRKSHPRELANENPREHRILRRAIPYSRYEGTDVGLLFLSYQASIAEQFEHIQRAWTNVPNFPQPATALENLENLNVVDPGYDPIVGTAGAGRARSIVYPGPNLSLPRVSRQADGEVEVQVPALQANIRRVGVNLERFVTMTGGGYFFAPSIAVLAALAAGEVRGDHQ